MTRSKFKANLAQALDCKDQYVGDETLEKFLDLNFDEDSSLADWDFQDFYWFATDVCQDGFWGTCREWDLHYPGEDAYF